MVPLPISHRNQHFHRDFVHQLSVSAIAITLLSVCPGRAFSPNELPEMGYHPSGPSYYGEVYFANAMWMEDRNWLVKKPKPGGESWEYLFGPPARSNR